MESLLAYFLCVVALCVGGYVLVQAARGTTDIFSVRNFFLLGFVVFQLTSGSLTLWTGYYDAVQCSDYATAGALYTVMVLVFLFLFLTFYKRGKLGPKLAAKVGGRVGAVGTGTLLFLAALFLLCAIFWRLVLAQIPVFGVLAMIVTSGLAAAAAGMAAWAWAPRWTNPAVALVALLIMGGSLAIVFYGDFGRRNALDIFLACIWGAHHGHWRHVGLRRARTQLITLVGGSALFLAAFTAGRRDATIDRNLSLTESFARLGSGDLGKGFMDMATGQAAAACSMWVIETRPDPFPHDLFHSLKYFLVHPVPRVVWPDKPIALGSLMTEQSGVTRSKTKGRSKEFSFGPGLMGHIWHDNPYITMIPYAFALALLVKFMDEIARRNPGNPFVIIPLGVALGDMVGIPRGEAGFFLARIFIMTASAWVGIGVCVTIARYLGVVMPPPDVAEPEHDRGEHYGEHDDLVDPQIAASYREHEETGRAA